MFITVCGSRIFPIKVLLVILFSVFCSYSKPAAVDSFHIELYLSYNTVTSLAANGDTIWAGTEYGGVVRCIESDSSFIQYTTSDGLAGNDISRIVAADTFGAVWVATDNGFSFVSAQEIRSYKEANAVDLGGVYDITSVGKRVGVICQAGVAEYRDGQLIMHRPLPGTKNFSGHITYGKDAVLWAVDRNGVYRFENNQMMTIDVNPDVELWSVNSIATDTNGHLWMSVAGSDSQFVARYDGVDWTHYVIGSGDLSHNTNVLRTDLDGNIISGGGAGVSRFKDDKWEVIDFWGYESEYMYDIAFLESNEFLYVRSQEPPRHRDGTEVSFWIGYRWLENNIIRMVSTDNEDNLWITPYMPKWGLHCYNGERWRYYSAGTVNLVHNYVTGHAQDSSGGNWFGTIHGLSYFQNGRWKRYDMYNGLPLTDIRDCMISHDNILWAGCKGGVLKYDGSEWKVYTTDDGLPNSSIYSITEMNGTIVAGAAPGLAYLENEVFVPDSEASNWYVYSLVSPFPDWLLAATGKGAYIKKKGQGWKKVLDETITCTDAETDSEGRIWIGTNSLGVVVIDTTGTVLFSLSKSDGILNSYISDIAIGTDGKVWIATMYGLCSVTLFKEDTVKIPGKSIPRKPVVQPRSRITGVYDIKGRRIAEQVRGHRPGLPAGVYMSQDSPVKNVREVKIK